MIVSKYNLYPISDQFIAMLLKYVLWLSNSETKLAKKNPMIYNFHQIISCKLNYKHKILWVEVYWSVIGKLLTSKLILAVRQADLNIQAQFSCGK